MIANMTDLKRNDAIFIKTDNNLGLNLFSRERIPDAMPLRTGS